MGGECEGVCGGHAPPEAAARARMRAREVPCGAPPRPPRGRQSRAPPRPATRSARAAARGGRRRRAPRCGGGGGGGDRDGTAPAEGVGTHTASARGSRSAAGEPQHAATSVEGNVRCEERKREEGGMRVRAAAAHQSRRGEDGEDRRGHRGVEGDHLRGEGGSRGPPSGPPRHGEQPRVVRLREQLSARARALRLPPGGGARAPAIHDGRARLCSARAAAAARSARLLVD